MADLETELKTECQCPKCVACCQRAPGWMTPEEARRAIDAGRARNLMVDWWQAHPHNIFVLCPASENRDGSTAVPTSEVFPYATFLGSGLQMPTPCSLLINGLCTIHDSGFKPIECRETFECKRQGPTRRSISKLWDTGTGREIVASWCRMVGVTKEQLMELY